MANLSAYNQQMLNRARGGACFLPPHMRDGFYGRVVSAAHRMASKTQQDLLYRAIVDDNMVHAVDWVNGALVEFRADRVPE